jgi:hypothetical protein
MDAVSSSSALIEYIRRNEIGAGIPVPSPFGTPRALLYADHTASGRALTHIEEVVQKMVLPHYGNTVSAELLPPAAGLLRVGLPSYCAFFGRKVARCGARPRCRKACTPPPASASPRPSAQPYTPSRPPSLLFLTPTHPPPQGSPLLLSNPNISFTVSACS